MARSDSLGSKLGPRFASLVVDAYVGAKGRTVDHTVRVGHQLVQQVLDVIGSEAAGLRSPLLVKLATHPELTDEWREYLQRWAGTPNWADIVGAIAGIFGVMGASAQVGQNELSPIVQSIIGGNPQLPIDIATIVTAWSRGLMPGRDAFNAAAKVGVKPDRLDLMMQAGMTYDIPASVLMLRNRELISDADAEIFLDRAQVDKIWRPQLLRLREQLLAPADLAAAVLRGWMTQADGAAEAALSGLSAKRFAVMVDNTGMPPGLMQLLEAYRRGIIDKSRLEHGIRTSDVRDEWIDVVEALRYQPPGYGVVIEAEVKGHLDGATARRMLSEAGIDPVNHDWMYAATGNPPGAGEMLELWRRGAVTQARVEQAMHQSHLADAFIPDALLLKRRIMPEGAVLEAQQAGALTHEQVISHLQDYGYDAADAAILAETGSRAKIAADWGEAKAIVTDSYMLGMLSRSEAADHLTKVGYDAHEADSILSVADLANQLSQLKAAVSKVRTRYVGYHIGAGEAKSALHALALPADQVDGILHTWTLEREAAYQTLTKAEIADAFDYAILNQDEAQTMLEGLGYPPLSAWTILSVKNKAALPGKPGG